MIRWLGTFLLPAPHGTTDDATMSMPKILLIAVCAGGLVFSTESRAQNDNISFAAPGFLIKKPGPGVPDVKAQPVSWPRLDPGAVLCRSEADLNRLGMRRAGETVDGPVDCRIVRAATGIAIVQRKGPGRTEVTTSDAKGLTKGWTDAWLPEKAPVRR